MTRLFIFLFFIPFLSTAQIPKPKPGTYINDYTNSLSADEIKELNNKLFLLEKQTTIQVAVLLINDLPADMAIEDYARDVGNTWKVGNAYNGIVYVAVLNARRQRLEIAKNLEGDIPDITAKEIIDNLKPYLQQLDYYGAIAQLILQIGTYTGVETNTITDTSNYYEDSKEIPYTPVDEERTKYEKEKAKYDSYKPFAFWAIITGAVVFIIWAYRHRKKYVQQHTINGIYMGVGSAYYASTHPSESSDGGGSSGFGGWGGGGGGGGFSGGGASGSW